MKKVIIGSVQQETIRQAAALMGEHTDDQIRLLPREQGLFRASALMTEDQETAFKAAAKAQFGGTLNLDLGEVPHTYIIDNDPALG